MPLNLPVEEGRAREIRAHDVAHAIGRVQQMTIDLRAIDAVGQERERNRRDVAAFANKRAALNLSVEIDAVAIESRRRAGLQPAPLEAERLQRLGELVRRRFAGATGRTLLRADVNEPVQERAGGDDERAASVVVAVLHADAGDGSRGDKNTSGFSNQPFDVRLGVERALHPAPVDLLSACARGDQTAGPRLRLSSLN